MKDKTLGKIVLEYFPEATKDFMEYIIWEKTGFPLFWNIPEDGLTVEQCFRKQLKEFKDEINETKDKTQLRNKKEV